MMNYMDNLSQGYQNTYGDYTQMYRKQPQTQIGGSQIKAPMRISLDRMYGGQPTAPPGPPTAPTFPMEIPESYVPTAGYDDYDQYLEEQKWTEGEFGWMPEGQEGQTYQNAAGTFVYQGGAWTRLSEEDDPWKFATGVETTRRDQLNAAIDHFNNLTQQVSRRLTRLNYQLGRAKRDKDYGTVRDLESQIAQAKQELAEGNRMIGEAQSELGALNEQMQTRFNEMWTPDIENWRDQLENLMSQFSKGEIDYIDDEGNFDPTALRGMGNTMSDWLADVLETSYETGLIQSDFFDEEGNLVPELQAMENYFVSSPEAMDRWNQYNKRLAMHAISSGQSIESGYYSEVVANAVAGYGARVADQVAPILMNEMKMQYQYIASSFQNMLVEAGLQQQSEVFASEMERAYAEIDQMYEMGMKELAAQIAESEAARRGGIFSGIFSFLVNLATSLIPGF